MPASEVMSLYRQHKLHSGPGGPVVKKKKQAVAIQISMARKEGHDIPKPKGSFQHGGLVPETGDYKVHRGEQIMPFSKRIAQGGGSSRDIEDRRSEPQSDIVYNPDQQPDQAHDIANRTRGAYEAAYHADLARAKSPVETFTSLGPSSTDPKYGIQGLREHVAQRMHEQGERAAGLVPSYEEGGQASSTGAAQAHAGEQVTDSTGGSTGEFVPFTQRSVPDNPAASSATAQKPPTAGGPPLKGKIQTGGGGSDRNPYLEQMMSNVAAPLHRVEGFKTGGTIPRTGIYRLHAGEHVIPANLARRYREMKRV